MEKRDIIFAGQLLAEVFRLPSPVFIPVAGGKPSPPPVFPGVELVTEEEAERYSWMGTPVVGTFSFSAGEYNTYNGKGQLAKKQYGDFLLPYATLVDFSRPLNMTQTKVLGNAGSVKEIYGLDDWNINIRGICLSDDTRPGQRAAGEQMEELIRWRNVADTINVSGAIFNSKNIYALCIKNLSITPEQGKPGVIPFTIEAVSDEPIELIL